MEPPISIPAPPPPALNDPWDADAAVPLDRVLERRQYPPLMTALLMLVLAFLLFQLVVSPIAIVLLLLLEGVAPADLLAALGTLMEERVGVVLAANTVGQIFGLAVPTVLVARLHASDWNAFVRLRASDVGMIGLALLGLAALTPTIQWLGTVNESLPLPDVLREFEQAQMDLIEQVLLGDSNVWITLFMLAVTPAFCEEILFRGYIQRQAERSLGILGGILFSGIAFGLYHLRLSQAIPLALLGVYLAYLTWRTGSLWPAVAVHFANNAFAVTVSAYVATNPELDAGDIEQMEIPWYYIAAGLLIFVAVLATLTRHAQQKLHERRRHGPASTPQVSYSES